MDPRTRAREAREDRGGGDRLKGERFEMTMTVEALHPKLRTLVRVYHRRGFPTFQISSYVEATEEVVEAVLSGATPAYTKPLPADLSDNPVVRACEKLGATTLASHGPQLWM